MGLPQQLFGWFIGLMVLLLLTLAALLRWVLAPLRRLEREIHAVEEGRSETLGQRLSARAERRRRPTSTRCSSGSASASRATGTRSAISPTA